jgi:putative membrane protein
MMWSGSWGWWGLGLVLGVICMAWMMIGHGHGHGAHGSHGGSHGHRGGGAGRILAERLARGEIDIDEYERRLTALQRAGELDRTEGVAR